MYVCMHVCMHVCMFLYVYVRGPKQEQRLPATMSTSSTCIVDGVEFSTVKVDHGCLNCRPQP